MAGLWRFVWSIIVENAKIEKEIGKLREDIESAEGRLKYLSSQIDLSTLTITFYKEIEAKTEKTNRFVEAFNDGIQAIENFGIFLVSIWPFAILISIVYLIVRRKFKKNKRTRNWKIWFYFYRWLA